MVWEGESLPLTVCMGRCPAAWLSSAVVCPVLEEHKQVAEGCHPGDVKDGVWTCFVTQLTRHLCLAQLKIPSCIHSKHEVEKKQ